MILFFILLVLAIICISYFIVLCVYAKGYVDFAYVWLVGALFCIAIALIFRYCAHHKGKLVNGLKVGASAILIVILIVVGSAEIRIIGRMKATTTEPLDYLIVLGAQVNGDKVTRSLRYRLDAAYEYLNDNGSTICIVSGGKGTGENVTEACAMREYLIARGISEDRIIEENRATSTKENIDFSMSIIHENENQGSEVGVVSSSFHIYRAEQICKKMGYEAQGIAAESDKVLLPHYMIREFAALVRYALFGMV